MSIGAFKYMRVRKVVIATAPWLKERLLLRQTDDSVNIVMLLGGV